jgi:hypothetical protein
MRSVSQFLVISVIGCGALNDIGQSVDKAVNSIDQAITDIEIDNTRWQSIVQSLSDKLPKDLQSAIHT